MKRLSIGTGLVLLGLCWHGVAQADQAEDEVAIRKCVASYTEAFNKRDAKGIAAHWLPEAVYIDPDSRKSIVGRPAIEKRFVEVFKDSKNVQLTVTVQSIRFISPHVAVEQGLATTVGLDKEPIKSNYTAIHLKREGKWLLDRVSEEEDFPVVSHYEKLKDLEWMIGSWIDDDDDEATTIETTCKWAKNQNFIVRTFSIANRDRVTTSGVQFIGWDPSAKKIRSWVFDSDGGHGGGFWTKKGKAWHIQTVDTLTSGQKATGVTILTPLEKNRYTWESIDRQVAGQVLPNISAVAVVRRPVDEQ